MVWKSLNLFAKETSSTWVILMPTLSKILSVRISKQVRVTKTSLENVRNSTQGFPLKYVFLSKDTCDRNKTPKWLGILFSSFEPFVM